MTDLISKLVDLSYEFTGIILPGAFLVIGFAVAWEFFPLIFETSSGPYMVVSQNADYLLTVVKRVFERWFSGGGKWGAVVFAFLISYVVGQALEQVSKAGLLLPRIFGERPPRGSSWRWCAFFGTKQPKSQAIRFLLLFGRGKHEQHSADLSDVRTGIARQLERSLRLNRLSLSEWEAFFPVARSFILLSGKRSQAFAYQNKYTALGSFATACALLFWVLLVLFVFNVGSVTCQGVINTAFLLFIFGALVVLFSRGFSRCWVMMGNAVICEVGSLLSKKE